ncbi:GPCR fungal pheromone mating factor [Mycena amicta]|nr:GPCR fungal pheromone mating factor [Mycena amicta]
MNDPHAIAVFVSATIGFFLMLLCLGAWSIGSSQVFNPARWLVFWVALSCLNEAINAGHWADSASIEPVSAGFCEVSTRIRIAAFIGIPAALLATNQRIYWYLVTVGKRLPGAYEECLRRKSLVDTALCAVPVALYILGELVDSLRTHRRFAILEGVGCVRALPYIASSIGGAFIPVFIITLFALFPGFKILQKGTARHEQLRKDIQSPHEHSFFIRLVILSLSVLLVVFVSLVFSVMAADSLDTLFVAHTVAPGIAQIPRDIWRGNATLANAIELGRWVEAGGPAIALAAFLLLGIDARARRVYGFVVGRLVRLDFRGLRKFEREAEPEARLPVYNRSQVQRNGPSTVNRGQY